MTLKSKTRKVFFEVVVDGKLLEYNIAENQSLLVFLESNGVIIEYGCRDGYCGACKCKLNKGVVITNKRGIGFVGKDEILTCVSIPISDLNLNTN